MQSADRYRTIPSVAGRLGRHITIGEERLLNLSSNDYLGLGDDPVLRSAWLEAAGADLPPMSSSSSRLLTGNHPLAEALEAELSALYGGRAAMLFNSGYHANTGILPALAGRHDLVLSDRLNHASIIDGLKISDANWKRYRHLDCDHLEEMLQEARGKRRQCFIVSESIFSMDGDLVDLKRLVELKKRYGAILILDEAHAVGTLGQEGLGLAEQEGLGGEVDIIVGTFGKAFASTGAYAIMAPLLREYLVNTARPFIFTTAIPPVMLSWSLWTLRRQTGMQLERESLQALASKLRTSLQRQGFTVPGESHIVPVYAGANSRAVAMAEALRKNGFLALPVRPPTVPQNTARIRISLRATLRWEDVEGVARVLGEVA
jgi:8-amino-7-oxononanoate synthase